MKHGLADLGLIKDSDTQDLESHEPAEEPLALIADTAYCQALKENVVAMARDLVSACRASGQRRDGFADTIENGNEQGLWGSDPLRVVALLQDVETRWSSTFLMMDRVLELYPVCFCM